MKQTGPVSGMPLCPKIEVVDITPAVTRPCHGLDSGAYQWTETTKILTMLKPAFQKDDALLTDIARCRNQPDRLHIWWLGQSGFLLQFAGSHLLFDPYLSDSLSRKYAGTDKPHVRVSERVIDPARLTMVDMVTSSHNHTDHLDAETLRSLMGANSALQFIIPEANRAFIADRLQADAGWPGMELPGTGLAGWIERRTVGHDWPVYVSWCSGRA